MGSVVFPSTPMVATFDQAHGESIEVHCSRNDIQNLVTALGKEYTLKATATSFIPKGKKVDIIANGASGASISPALSVASVASTAKSSTVSTTPLTWKDEQNLEDATGRAFTNKLLNTFDPTSNALPREHLTTVSINNPHKRYVMHQLIERVWAGRLFHETANNCIHIWSRGAKVPKWLEQKRINSERHNVKKASTNKAVPTQTTTAAEIKHAPAQGPRPVNAVWTTFAQETDSRYGRIVKMTGDQYHEAMSENAKPEKTSESNEACTFIERFKQITNGATVKGDRTAVVEPKKVAALPPHLRGKSVAKKVEVTQGNTSIEPITWVAARLPNPCSSD